MRGRTIGSPALTLVPGLALPGAAAAGPWPHERDGVVLGFNVVVGSAGVTPNCFDSDRESGVAPSGRILYAFDPQWAIGLEGNARTKEVDGESWTFSVGGVAATYYPGAGRFFVRGGVGSGRDTSGGCRGSSRWARRSTTPTRTSATVSRSTTSMRRSG